jgi:hypothetical protein
VADYAKAVRTVCWEFEKCGIDGGARWDRFWKSSQPINFDALEDLVSAITKKRRLA